jgi:peptidylprolyl isomerase
MPDHHPACRALLLILLVALAACGEDTPAADVGDATTTAATTPAAAGVEAPEVIQPGSDTAGVEVQGEDTSVKPEITLPGGEPPSELIVVDLIEGDGEAAAPGGTVTTHYVGLSWLNDGTQFDSSWERGEPATFSLDLVIPGWTEGIPGMKVGGRRLLVIPPELAYGAQPPSPDIALDDTLVFVIDLTEVQ